MSRVRIAGVTVILGALVLCAPAVAERAPDAPLVDTVLALAGDPNLDFNLLEPAKPAQKADVNSQELDREIIRRRHMLQLHQALGFATLATLAATDIVGQLNLNDKYGAGGVTNRYELLHVGLATATLGLFASVALLGAFAPSPYPKPFRLDTATLHKGFMILASIGMLMEVVLGVLASTHEGSISQRDFVTWHQVSGYASLGAMAAGVTVLLF